MQVENLFLADYANLDSSGKLNLIGMFASIHAKDFPCQHRSMYVVIKVEAEPGELDETRELSIRILDEDGNEIARLPMNFQVPSQGVQPVHYFIVEFRDIVFSRPGRYEFRVFIDKDHKRYIPLDVIQIPTVEEQKS